jgi:AcrR family transcriptional regulator
MSQQTRARRPGRPPGSDGTATRHRILHAARKVFSSTGFDRASLVEIAREAGITRNAISNYYPSKIELHQAAFASIHHDALTEIMSDLPGPDQPAMSRIYGLFEAAIRMNAADDTFVRFWVTSTLDAVYHPQLRDQSEHQFGMVQRFFREAIDLGKVKGEITEETDSNDLAQVIVDLLWGLAMDSGFRSEPARVTRVMRALELLLLGSAVTR